MSQHNVIEFDQVSFEGAKKGSQPVLVDFYATWCGPCKALAPVLEEVAAQFQGKVVIGKVDVDQHPEIATPYGVRSIPTLVVLKGGQEVKKHIGGLSKAELVSLLESVISAD